MTSGRIRLMAGLFELFTDEESQVRFRLVAPDGRVLAVSDQFADKQHAAAAIKDVRECAGTGLIHDLSPSSEERAGAKASRSRRPMVRAQHGFVGPFEAA